MTGIYTLIIAFGGVENLGSDPFLSLIRSERLRQLNRLKEERVVWFGFFILNRPNFVQLGLWLDMVLVLFLLI